MRLKAVFPNQDGKLWPGDFVNARVLVQTRHAALTIPSAAVQRGPSGVFAYVVTPDATVQMRPLQIGGESGALTIVEQGLEAGDRVTTNNQYRLQAGAHVSRVEAAPASPAGGGKATP